MGQPPENRRAAAARAILRGARIWALPLLLAVACTESPSMRTPSPTVTSATRTVATPIAVPTPSAAIKRFVPFDISEPPGSAPPRHSIHEHSASGPGQQVRLLERLCLELPPGSGDL